MAPVFFDILLLVRIPGFPTRDDSEGRAQPKLSGRGITKVPKVAGYLGYLGLPDSRHRKAGTSGMGVFMRYALYRYT